MHQTSVSLHLPEGLGPAASFGAHELSLALVAQGYALGGQAPAMEIVLRQADLGAPESYHISRPQPTTLSLTGSDENGLLYACLDLAEQLALGRPLEAVAERSAAPALAVRGVYLFLHNGQAERDWVCDPAFWQSYADELARDRYNRFNLIYGHQSPYLVPIYAFMLDDLDEAFPEIRVQGITPEERARHLRALQLASAAMADRGITFFLGIWNSRPWKIENGVWETQPTRVTGTDDLGRLEAYTRQGFARLMELCPSIGGIQFRMNIEAGIGDQRFFVQAFVPVLKELVAGGRRLTCELRNWGLHPDTVEAFRSAGMPIVVSTKYFAEHQAMPYQPPDMRGSYSYDSFLRKDKPFPFQWHVWNLGSHRLFNWGDPDYARRFALSCRLGDGVGFEVTPPGSQKGFSQWGQVNPGDWQARSDLPKQWDFQRYWFFHLAFGRMAYDTNTPDEVFVHQLARRTSAEAAPILLAAYRAASQVISYLISQRMDDPNMYVWPELDCGGPIDHNTIAPPGEVTLFATAREHAQGLLAGRGSAKLSPWDCARDLDGFASAIEEHLAALAALPGLEDNLECRTIRVDFRALADLARYHAAKSRATGNLALFYVSGERRYLDAAEAEAEEGVRLWDVLCAHTEVYYPKLHLGPSGGHWRDNKPRVRYDLRRIRRVRELFAAYGLFERGFDFGPAPRPTWQFHAGSGLEPEPRFIGVDGETAYSRERGYGWTRTAGLRAGGFAPLTQDALWGVHYMRPGADYDPAAVERVPLDGLTQRYLMADEPRTFRVDLPDGDYEVTLIVPALAGLATPVRVGDTALELGGVGLSGAARVRTAVQGGALDIVVGGRGTWALAGLVVRPLAPQIAHLKAMALRAEADTAISATVAAPDAIRSVVLRYRSGGDWREEAMTGDGVAYQATVPAAALTGDSLAYELIAETVTGRVSRRAFEAPIVRGYRAPRITRLEGPERWSSSEPELLFRVHLEHGENARELRLHYREADQNRSFRIATQPGGRSGEVVFRVSPQHLDDAYELIYYVEVLDALGGGSFCPDPFTEARYIICKPR